MIKQMYVLIEMPNGTTVSLPARFVTFTQDDIAKRVEIRAQAISTDELIQWAKDAVDAEVNA